MNRASRLKLAQETVEIVERGSYPASDGRPVEIAADVLLGAWGCGVFRNDPAVVAGAFAHHLRRKWAGRFERVWFSVLDTSPDQGTFRAFSDLLIRRQAACGRDVGTPGCCGALPACGGASHPSPVHWR